MLGLFAFILALTFFNAAMNPADKFTSDGAPLEFGSRAQSEKYYYTPQLGSQ